MPRKPKKPCSYPGCPELIEDGSYCKKNIKEMLIDTMKNIEEFH